MVDQDGFALDGGIAQHPPVSGNKVVLYNDAARTPRGGGAFSDLLNVIRNAQHFVFIADWSFQPLAVLEPKGDNIGTILVQKARSGLRNGFIAAVHTWRHLKDQRLGHLPLLRHFPLPSDPENDAGDEILNDLSGGVRPRNLLWRASTREEASWSLHQKFVVADSAAPKGRRSLVAFCGGLDLTRGRFDWPTHPNLPHPGDRLPNDGDIGWMMVEKQYPRRRDAGYWKHDEWYNNEFGPTNGAYDLPRQAWHDAYMKIDGPAAWAFVREFLGRWLVDPTKSAREIEEVQRFQEQEQLLLRKFRSLFNPRVVVQEWDQVSANGPWSIQVVRSLTRDQWTDQKFEAPSPNGSEEQFNWKPDAESEASIQAAYIRMIEEAQRFLYVETQYLIGSGGKWDRASVSNQIPEKIVEKILEKIKESSPFHAYIVLPLFPEGDPVDVVPIVIRHFQRKTIEYMVSAVAAAATTAGRTWTEFLSFYFLAQWRTQVPPTVGDRHERVRAAQRYMIYVHSKMMICDDRFILIGSANLNERSLAGDRDAEICACLWPANDQSEFACTKQVKEFRRALWAEHLGRPSDRISDSVLQSGWWYSPESTECVSQMQKLATVNYLNFRRGSARSSSGHLCKWPFSLDSSGDLVWEYVNTAKDLNTLRHAFADVLIPDSPTEVPQGTHMTEVMNDAWCLIPPVLERITLPLKREETFDFSLTRLCE